MTNPVLEEYLAAIAAGKREFGLIVSPDDLHRLDALGLVYETEETTNELLFVRARICADRG